MLGYIRELRTVTRSAPETGRNYYVSSLADAPSGVPARVAISAA